MVGGLVLACLAIWAVIRMNAKTDPTMQDLLVQDRIFLSDDKLAIDSKNQERALQAMIRLTASVDPAALDAAFRFGGSEFAHVRKEAAKAMAIFYEDPRARAGLEKLFHDPQEIVRRGAIEAMILRMSDARVQRLRDLAHDSRLSVEDRFFVVDRVFAALIAAPAAKTWALQEIQNLLKTKGLSEETQKALKDYLKSLSS